MAPRMDAAVPVDAQNASTATWKTAQNAVSHSAHTHHCLTSPAHRKPDTPQMAPESRSHLYSPVLFDSCRAQRGATGPPCVLPCLRAFYEGGLCQAPFVSIDVTGADLL